MGVRAIATDVDGTLLRTDGSLSARTLSAVRAAEARGILVVMATARPPRWVRTLVDEIGDLGIAVCANGAIVYDAAQHSIVASHDIPVSDAREIVRRLRESFPQLGIGLEQGLNGRRDPDYVPLHAGPDDAELGLAETFLDAPTAKIFAGYRGEAPPDLPQRVRKLVAGLADVTFSADHAFLELMRPGVDKAKTVEAVIAERGISAAEVLAFGDMPNDIELLTWAGRGVAVANAHPDVLAAADEITASNDEDGVAIIVERILTDAPNAPQPLEAPT